MYNKFDEIRGTDKTIRAIYCTECKFKYPVSLTEKMVKDSGVICPECGSTETISEKSLIKKKSFNLTYCKNIVYGFVMDSPLKPYLGDFIRYNTVDMKDADSILDGETVKIGGIVTRVKKYVDKRGNEMAFITLSDGENDYDLIVFASLWQHYDEVIKKGSVYVFNVKVDNGKFLLNGDNAVIKLMLKKNV
jgi:DNA polymerase III alpha subunit